MSIFDSDMLDHEIADKLGVTVRTVQSARMDHEREKETAPKKVDCELCGKQINEFEAWGNGGWCDDCSYGDD